MKIVVVEDNEILAKSIAKVLTSEGHSVRIFADGLEARTCYCRSAPCQYPYRE